MSVEYKNTKDLIGSLFPIKILLYGQPGTGKTLFGATLPNPTIIDTCKGMITLRGLDIPYVTIIEEDRNRPKAWAEILRVVNEYLQDATVNDTLIIDELTSASEYALNHSKLILQQIGKPNTYDTWGQLLILMQDFVERLIAAPCNVVCVCYEEETKDELQQTIVVRPMLAGQSQKKVPHYFGEVYRLFTNSRKEHIIQTHADLRTQAKSRLNRQGVLDSQIVWEWDESNPYTNPVFESIRKADEEFMRKNEEAIQKRANMESLSDTTDKPASGGLT